MKLTVQLRLLPTAEQASALMATMTAFNAAATHAARVGFEAGVFSPPPIQRLCYRELRERFGLSAQLAVRAIGKAAEVFRRDKSRAPEFRPDGAVTYDERCFSFKGPAVASILTLQGRALVPMIYGEYQRQRFDRIKGQVDLVLHGGHFYLYATIDMPEGAPVDVQDFLGVDLGIVSLATTSDGETFTGSVVERIRARHAETRRRLQKRGSRGAKKILRRLSGRERRFRSHTNHCIAKNLVARAKDTSRALVLENLSGIRKRTEPRLRREQRARHGGWAFRQLRDFVEYKAALAGVPVVLLDPAHSSRTCSECGHCDKANRRSQSEFACLHCGFSANADINAARTLRAWAACRPASELPRLAA